MLRLAYLLYRVFLFLFRPLTLGVRVMMVKDGQVVLVRQTYMPGWFMPGGGLQRGETLEEGARREIREECGGRLNNLILMGAYSNFKEWKSDHNVLFFSDDFSLGVAHDREIAELRMFPLGALPDGLWPGHRKRLEEYACNPHQINALQPFPRYGEW